MTILETIRSVLRDNPIVRGVDELPRGHVRVETRLQYPDGASIELFVPAQDGLFPPERLTDFGQTTDWLLDLGIKPWLSKKRQAFLQDAIEALGARQRGGELEWPLSDLRDIPEGVLRLGQACLRAADLVFTRRSSLQLAFVEEVEEVIGDTDMPYSADVPLEGRFGKRVPVDFLVRGARAESAVLTLSSGSRSAAHTRANEVFSRWFDLEERPEQRVTVYDDSRDVYRDEDLRRIEEKSELLAFSDREQLRRLLVAA